MSLIVVGGKCGDKEIGDLNVGVYGEEEGVVLMELVRDGYDN